MHRCFGDHGLHQARAERGRENEEPRQHRGQGDVQAGAVGAEHGVGADRRRPRRRPAPTRCPAGRGRRTDPARRDPGGVGRHQPQRHGPVGRHRPARPDVAVGFAGGGDPALAGVEPDLVTVGGGGAERRPEVAAGPGFGEGQGAQVMAGGDLPAGLVISVGLEDGGRRVVHQHDHRRRSAGAGQALDDRGHLAHAEAATSDIGTARQSEQSGSCQGVNRRSGEATFGVHCPGIGCHHVGDHRAEGVFVHSHPVSLGASRAFGARVRSACLEMAAVSSGHGPAIVARPGDRRAASASSQHATPLPTSALHGTPAATGRGCSAARDCPGASPPASRRGARARPPRVRGRPRQPQNSAHVGQNW